MITPDQIKKLKQEAEEAHMQYQMLRGKMELARQSYMTKMRALDMALKQKDSNG